MPYKILFSNIGYAKDINGTLWQHIARFGRHFYSRREVQERALRQLKNIIEAANPDLCCLVEIDSGSLHSGRFNQMQALLTDHYRFHDIADKYGEGSRLGRLPLHKGKSNAFLTRYELPFERLYFRHGSKRLIYRIALEGAVTVFFAHFSLRKKTRARQFEEFLALIKDMEDEIILMADFNIFGGFTELEPLLRSENLVVLNNEQEHTFNFSGRKLTLDLCICSKSLAERARLSIIPQPFSDHAALLLEIGDKLS